MNKITFLGFIFIFNIINIYPNEPEKIVAYVNQKFSINICTQIIPDNGIEHYWQLINFDKNVFTKLAYYTGAPDWFGGDLYFESWDFKANKIGNFNFVFKKYSDEKIIQVNIIDLTLLDKIKLLLKSLNFLILRK